MKRAFLFINLLFLIVNCSKNIESYRLNNQLTNEIHKYIDSFPLRNFPKNVITHRVYNAYFINCDNDTIFVIVKSKFPNELLKLPIKDNEGFDLIKDFKTDGIKWYNYKNKKYPVIFHNVKVFDKKMIDSLSPIPDSIKTINSTYYNVPIKSIYWYYIIKNGKFKKILNLIGYYS